MKKSIYAITVSLLFVFSRFSFSPVESENKKTDSFSSPSAEMSFLNSGDMARDISASDMLDAFEGDNIAAYGGSTTCSSGCSVSCSTYCSTNCSRSCSNRCN